MIVKIFAIHDSKAKNFGPPFTYLTIDQALRGFEDAVNRPGILQDHPNDFTLYEIGTYDDSDSSLLSLTPIRLLAVGSEFKKHQELSINPVTSAGLEPMGATSAKSNNNKKLTEVK